MMINTLIWGMFVSTQDMKSLKFTERELNITSNHLVKEKHEKRIEEQNTKYQKDEREIWLLNYHVDDGWRGGNIDFNYSVVSMKIHLWRSENVSDVHVMMRVVL